MRVILRWAYRTLAWLMKKLRIRLYLVKMTDEDIPSLTKIPLKTWRHQSWIRIPMYNLIEQFFASRIGRSDGKIALEIGGSEGTLKSIMESFGFAVQVAEEYPRIDINKLPFEDNSYDAVLLDQVLEHIAHPWVAVQEVKRILRPGGIAIATVPFIMQYHADRDWKDYWRFTPDGLRLLFEEFEVLTSAGWGNADSVRAMYQDDVTSIHNTPLSLALDRKLFDKPNDGLNFLTCWIVARKPKS